MATRYNTRRRVVETNQYANAEGVVPLSFSNFQLHSLAESNLTSKRNGLPLAKVLAINPENGDTIALLAQMQIREKLLHAAIAAAEGATVTLKRVSGARVRPDFNTGMTTVAVKSLELHIQAPPPAELAAPAAAPRPEAVVPTELVAASASAPAGAPVLVDAA